MAAPCAIGSAAAGPFEKIAALASAVARHAELNVMVSPPCRPRKAASAGELTQRRSDYGVMAKKILSVAPQDNGPLVASVRDQAEEDLEAGSKAVGIVDPE